MSLHWLSCPHCKVLFQYETTQPLRQCRACRAALPLPAAPVARLVPAPVAVIVSAPRVHGSPDAGKASAAIVAPPRPVQTGWFYAHNKKKWGPISFAELRQRANSGQLLPGDMVLQGGTQKWQPASAVPGLFPSPPPTPAKPQPSMSASAPPPTARMHVTPLALPHARPNGPPATLPPNGRTAPNKSGWHYAKAKKKIGPITRQQLEQLAEGGQLLREDMVLPEGSAKWVEARCIDQLFPEVSVSDLAGLANEPGAAVPLALLPARARPASGRACPHCKGTAFCGRYWDADGMIVRGPVCAACKETSGLEADRDVDKVTCSVCQGKGFQPDEPAENASSTVRKDAVAWRLQALSLSDTGRYQEAISAYSEAIRLAPDFADAYYERGWAYLAANQSEPGEADLAAAARLSPCYAATAEDNTAPADARLGFLARLFQRRRR